MRRAILAIFALGVVVALVALVGGVSGPTPGPTGSPPRPAASVYSDKLAQASQMTQQMSAPGQPTGHEYHPHDADEQLQLSSNPEFVRELEQYQADIDRMLAQNQ